ncbi:hypothetical protein JZO81_05460 [Enterococcus hulanensis]|uniref:hypothetical protein n=1 Tax=Enterococcus TaxID=1350 RepID=UPI000B5A449B|nr:MULTISPECIES: hypothetical protein [Enterococcus]MBO0410491.1 hypothetical protein [Enterococcus hulanensis]OTO14331.1 hypothetical protein A5875_003488 [Enterococcus sp. 3H8_DIV0648]
MKMENNIEMGMDSTEEILQEEIRRKIETLEYTTEETKDIYFQQLAKCDKHSELQELINVIEIGEQQLYEIEKSMFQTLEDCIWRINEFKYLPMAEKNQWIEKVIACDLPESMDATYTEALEAENEASNTIRETSKRSFDGWTIFIDY